MADVTTQHSGRQLRSIISRATASIQGDKATPTNAMHQIVGTYETAVTAQRKKERVLNLSEFGVKDARYAAFMEADAMIGVQVESVTRHAKDHAEQLRAELHTVPEVGNAVVAREIRDYLRTMSPAEVDHFLSQTSDPETVSAVVHGPKILALGSDTAREAMLRAYNTAHRPDKLQLLDDCETLISAVEGYADIVKRQLRDDLGLSE
jgi:hypothetical protein